MEVRQPQVGEVLAGKYRIERVIGVGGMGVVLEATHLHLEQRVALKFLLPAAVVQAEAAARFAREAKAAARIRSEHVARVIDVGTLETGALYLVMEYLDGWDLAAYLRDRGAMAVSNAVDALLQVCEALAEAHTVGVVHRDLKPANLFITTRSDGSTCLKVLDFGISKLTNASSSDASLTRTSAIMGSPLYMSPEQMTASRNVDARSDIWSVGVVLYELLSGRAPFLADTLPQICARILTEPVAPLLSVRADLPAGLDAVIERCLEKDPARRFQDVGELASALSPFASRATSRYHERILRILGAWHETAGAPSLAREQSPEASGAANNTRVATAATWAQTQAPVARKWPIISAALFGAVAAAGVAWLLAVRSDASVPASTSATASPGSPAVAAVLLPPPRAVEAAVAPPATAVSAAALASAVPSSSVPSAAASIAPVKAPNSVSAPKASPPLVNKLPSRPTTLSDAELLNSRN